MNVDAERCWKDGDVSVAFEPVSWPDDADEIIEFLVSNEWPFRRQVAHESPVG